MRVLVTGATGFLGGMVTQDLVAQGHDVVAMGRDTAKLAQITGAETIACDLSQGALPTLEPADAMIHCAALSSPWGPHAAFEAANVVGTVRAVALARTIKVRRFVNIASPTVYFTMQDQEGVTEDMPLPPPVNAYADTKARAEAAVLAADDIGPISLRPRGIYGAGDTALLPRLMRAAQKGPLPVLNGGRAAIDLTHVSDVVSAIRAALVAGPDAEGQIINISGGEQLAIRDIVQQAAARAQQPVTWRNVPFTPALWAAKLLDKATRTLPRLGEPRVTPYALGLFAFRQSLNIDRARRVLGWSPAVSFQQGLDLTFDGGLK